MAELNAQDLPEICEQNDIQWFNLETGDHKAPDEDTLSQWGKYKDKLVNVINQNGKLAVHCKGGLGRTGVGTAMQLLELG